MPPSRPTLSPGVWILCLLLLLVPDPALCLTPADLLVVYNADLPDSLAVARHYAKVRGIPADNLVGLNVTTAEKIPRQDFLTQVLPPVRDAVQRLQRQGRTPVIVTIYGIPLVVSGDPATTADRDFKAQAASRQAEVATELQQVLTELNALVPAGRAPSPGYPRTPVLKTVQETLSRVSRLLTNPRARLSEDQRARIITLASRLAGSPGPRGAASPLEDEPSGTPAPGDTDRQSEARDFFWGLSPSQAEAKSVAVRLRAGLVGEMLFWERVSQSYRGLKPISALDSELCLVLVEDYHTATWLPNPFRPAFDRLPGIGEIRGRTVMVSRLDGPTPAIAQRLATDAKEVEATGLQGIFYIDSRGLKPDEGPGGYGNFDQHLVTLADLLKQHTPLKVVLDKNPAVFPPFACPTAALYVGWYSLSRYVTSFNWVKGAVGYHVASSEATTLRDKNSRVWCKRMLEEGVAATLGPVAEPYLHSFPLPDKFFPLLLTGQYSLVEVYYRTIPHVSWMQVLIGDPLYTPFGKKPAWRGPAEAD